MVRDNKRVMLVVPPRTILDSSVKRCCTPIGLGYIAGVLQEKTNYDIYILDCYAEGYRNEKQKDDGYIKVGLDKKDIVRKIEDFQPDYVGVTCGFTSEIKNVMDVCRIVKEVDNNINLTVGGLHPSNYPKETYDMYPEIDSIILGEGDYRYLDYINGDLKDGIYNSKKHVPFTSVIEDMNTLPFPARNLMNMDIYLKINRHISPYPKRERTEQILTSRGCPGKCVFCTSSRFWGHHFRARSPDNVLKEMHQLIDNYGIQEFQFTDDTMTLDRKRAMSIFQGMEGLDLSFCMANGVFVNSLNEEMMTQMAKSGCYQITFSVESGSKDSLKRMRKNVNLDRVKPLVKHAKNLGISCHGTFVLGIPGDTEEDIMKSFKFARMFDSVSFFEVSPLPGSELYDICIEKDMLKDLSFDKLDFKNAKVENPQLSSEKLDLMIRKENNKYVKRFLVKHPIKFYKKYNRFIKENPKEFLKIFGRVT